MQISMRTAQAKTKWLDTPSSEWTVSLAKKLLAELEGDDQFKIEAVLGTRVYDPAAQLALLDAALSATERSLSQYTSPKSSHSAYNLACNAAVNQDYVDELRQVLEDNAAAVKLLEQRYRLLELQDKTRTWQEIYGSNASPVASGSGSPSSQDQDAASPSSQEQNEMQGSEEHDSVVEESWQFDEDEAQTDLVDADLLINTDEALPADKASDNTCLLPDFLDTSVEESAFSAAANNEIDILRTLFTRHARQLNPLRLDVLDTVPLFSDVTEYTDLLPKFDPSRKVEVLQEGRAWRTDSNEWKSEPIVRNSLGLAPEYPTWTPSSAERLADWYQRRIRELDEVTGQVDNALSLVQYGAAQDLPGLDALGEQLSLLSRLVYDRRSAGSAHANQQAWSLKKWQSSSEADIVDAYLSQSTPETIVQDIRGQVLPYLYVLESQRERAGKPDPKLHDTLLFDWMLRSAESPSPANLETIAAIFDASKPTLPAVQRIVRSDEDLARLALACCYGHPGVSARGVQAMLRIFDCLPSFEESAAPSPPRDTDSLLAVVRSTASAAKGDKLLSSTDLWAKMKLWSASALSRALDTLDLHLEAAEIFQRWSAPVALQSFILLSADEKGQRLWADRLAKTSPAAVAHLESQERIGRDFEDEDEWISLLDDLCKLGGKAAYTGSDPRPAFSALSQQDITKIFFGGLLSSAKFRLAKSLFQPSSGERPLDSATEQDLVLAASREFYDNAESGNLHSGNMKLALDCLSVAPNTPEIRREREFIEATSRLASFNVLNGIGQPLTPLEIRLAPDKLELVSRILASNEDAYRHPDVLLELVAKLGFRGDTLAETKVLGMLADAAMQAEDSKRAGDVCDRMIKAVEQTRRCRDSEKATRAAEIAWRTCYRFGCRASSSDVSRRKELLGHALLLCPPANIPEVLSVWQTADSAAEDRRPLKTARKDPGVVSPTLHGSLSLPFSLSSRPTTPNGISQSAETAARAALSVGKAATSYLPFRASTPDTSLDRPMTPTSFFTGRGDQSSSPAHRSGQSPARDGHVRHALESKLKLGVGWLLGADEEEL